MNNKKVTGYKVTDKNMQCRGFQYELGKIFEFQTGILKYSGRSLVLNCKPKH